MENFLFNPFVFAFLLYFFIDAVFLKILIAFSGKTWTSTIFHLNSFMSVLSTVLNYGWWLIISYLILN